MTELEMEDLIWNHTEHFFGEPLKQFRRQMHTDVGRPDLIFETRTGQLLVVEIKKGTASREVIGQVYDYFGALKQEFPPDPLRSWLSRLTSLLKGALHSNA